MLFQFLLSQVLQVTYMAVSCHQHMARVIGVAVQNHKVGPATVKDIMLGVIISRGFFTEKAVLQFAHFYKLHAPWCPDTFHKALLIP